MIILDTNIVSEVWRPRPHSAMLAWLDDQDQGDLYLCTPVLAELHFGAERLHSSHRKQFLHASITKLQTDVYRDRILPFDTEAAAVFGRIGAARERLGRRMQAIDAMIAAIAFSKGMRLATRDTDDFTGIGLELINPFEVSAKR